MKSPANNKGQSGSVPAWKRSPDKAQHSESSAFGRLTFERWLRTLESCPDLLALEAKTPRNLLRYKSAFRRWKEAGFPSPTEPPEEWRRQVDAYTEKWMLQWCDSGKQDFLLLNPKRLINLWDMIQFPAYPLLTTSMDLHFLKEYLSNIDPQDRTNWPRLSKQFSGTVELISEVAKELELTETLGRCQRFNKIIAESATELIPTTGILRKTLTKPEIISEIEGIEGSLDKELFGIQFVHIPQLKSKYCEQSALFGEAVNKAFPSATSDIKDAGNCLAVDLNTAAVFHLMRATEFGMRALAVHLKVRLKQKPIEHGGWSELIEQIEKKIRLRRERYDRGRRKNKKELEFLKFCRMMADELYIFKEIWRDNTMHSISSYNESEAKGVFERVRDFMQRLATKVTEK
jgi:hypothetical protein